MAKRRGFSLLETLISLIVFSFIVLATLGCFINTRSYFLKMKQKHETGQSALSALDKIRRDVLQSGKGLLIPSQLKLLESISCSKEVLSVQIADHILSSPASLVSGQTRIPLSETEALKEKRKLCIFDSNKGEVKEILLVDSYSCVVSSPLLYSYEKNKVRIILLRELQFYLDEKQEVLRRKVNSSPAQPLLEDVHEFSCFYDDTSNLVRATLSLKNNQEKKYETFIFPKNPALALFASK